MYMIKGGAVYIMSNDRETLYTGVSSNLSLRVFKHKNNWYPSSFTAKYSLYKLIYYEAFETIELAIIREKQIKDMNRVGKLKMIKEFNPKVEDLYKNIQM